jgi:hypothetical protein
MLKSCAAALAALCLMAGSAIAGSVTLFSGTGFAGPSITVNQDVRNLADFPPWNDRARSLIVNSGMWEICKDSKYRDCVTLRPGTQIPDLDEVGLFRKVSSLREVQNLGWRDDWHDGRDWADRDRDDREWGRWDRRDRDFPVAGDGPWGRRDRWDDRDWPAGERLSACQQRVYDGFVDRYGARAPARFRGGVRDGDVNWDGRWWHFACDGDRVNIWR